VASMLSGPFAADSLCFSAIGAAGSDASLGAASLGAGSLGAGSLARASLAAALLPVCLDFAFEPASLSPSAAFAGFGPASVACFDEDFDVPETF